MRRRRIGVAFRTGRGLAGVVVTVWITGLVGCAERERPFEPKPTTVPPVRFCFDTVGHRPGSKPWILGGTCCCTPTAELLEQYHADGFCLGMTLQDLIGLYDRQGIKTALDHQGCNNACPWGPHVLKGGKCMVPPTPATKNYEEILTGVIYVPQPAQGKRPD